MEQVVRVAILDDHQWARRQLAVLLNRQMGIQVVEETEAREQALDKVAMIRPDVVLLECKTGNGSGATLCAKLVRCLPESAVLVLTSYPDPEERERVLQAGATGYYLKNLDSTELIEAVRSHGQRGRQQKESSSLT